MPLLEEIKQMQNKGYDEAAIAQNLQEQGFNPREINEAMDQSRIKSAISADSYEQNGQEAVMNNSPNEMQPSITSQPEQMQEEQQVQQPAYAEQYQQYYPQQEYYSPQPAISPETISEIADQIISERISTIKKALNIITEFKSFTEAKVSNMDSRLKKIEATIDRLQLSIIGKIGDYGKSVQEIKEELSGMEEAFSKVINPLVEKARHISTSEHPVHHEHHESQPRHEKHEEKPAHHKPEHKTHHEHPKHEKHEKHHHSKSKDGFENYLR